MADVFLNVPEIIIRFGIESKSVEDPSYIQELDFYPKAF